MLPNIKIIKQVWIAMRSRCYNPKCPVYKWYGANGVTICEHWKEFKNFYNDMQPSYKAGLQIDRVKGAKVYSKDTCKWSTHIEQQRNRRNNRELTLNGKTMLITDWAALLNISYSSIYYRLRNGWTVEDALSIPFKTNNAGKGICPHCNKEFDKNTTTQRFCSHDHKSRYYSQYRKTHYKA